MSIEKKSPFLSTGFFTSALMVIGGIFLGFQEEFAKEIVGVVLGGIATFKMIRDWAKDGLKVDLKKAVKNGNWWQNISVVVLGIVPSLPPSVIGSVQNIIDQLMANNMQGALIAGVGLVVIIYETYFKKTIESMQNAASH
jgi:hypothetical protein